MRTGRSWATVCVAGTLCVPAVAGELDPPGPPEPTPGPEARVAVNETNTPGDDDSVFKISGPGSYYLTGNVTGASGEAGIEIASDGVTLDLNGFELVGVEGSLDGVVVTTPFLPRSNIAVRNGTVRSWGEDGVDVGAAVNVLVEDVAAVVCGRHGIVGSLGGVISGCAVSSNVDRGISVVGSFTISECAAVANIGVGISAGDGSTVVDCTANSNGSAPLSFPGIHLGDGSAAVGCVANGNDQAGIVGRDGCTVTSCTANGNAGTGIFVQLGSSVVGCSARDNEGLGISGSNVCRVESSIASSNDLAGIAVGLSSAVLNCSSISNLGEGINAGSGCSVQDCVARGNSIDGIVAATGSSVSGCTSSGNSGDGILTGFDTQIVGNVCQTNGVGTADGAGIHVTGSGSRVDGNSVTDNDRGIDVDDRGNLIVRNSAQGNTTDYDIAAGNDVGTMQTSPVGAGAWDNLVF